MTNATKLHPDFPVVEGRLRLTREWEIDLPGKFNRRVEDGNLVVWQPGLTFWIAVWKVNGTPEETLQEILGDAAPSRLDEKIERTGDVIRLTYRLVEHDPERTPPAYTSISGYVLVPSSELQITGYCDHPQQEKAALQVIASAQYRPGERS